MTKEDRLDKQYLLDISDAIDSIYDFLDNKTKEDFESSYLLQSAIIRQFEIIGEAASRLSDNLKEEFTDISWKNVIGMRHKMIHDYFEVSIDVVWDTIQNDLNGLKLQIDRIIKEIK